MIALGLALAAAAAAPPEVSPLVVRPQASRPPPADATVDMAGDDESPRGNGVSIWPAGALQQRWQGAVTLTCWINLEGLADWCRVAFERPAGRGFGAAAMAARPHIKVAPRKGPDGAPVAGLMNVAMSFKTSKTDTVPVLGKILAHAHNPVSNARITLMTNPVWAKTPTFEAVERAYPRTGGGAGGFAVAHCQVHEDGRLSRCGIATEAPRDQGFGAAAVKLATDFRVQPGIMARAPKGEPIAVEVPIRFPAPGAPRTVTAPSWLQGFDTQAAPKLFPPQAAAKGLTSGHGVARCVVGADGALTACAPAGDDPEGFSQAAAKLAGAMRMNLWSADARPVEGGTVYVGMRLDLKGAS
jgi:TonB family protein